MKCLNFVRLPVCCILSYKSPYKQYWDLFILLLALQNSYQIPIDLTFAPDYLNEMWYQIFDNSVDFLFFIDMMLMFFTSYFDGI